MITQVRLFESCMVGPRATLPGELAPPETTVIPPRRPGLTCDMTATPCGVLVLWKSGDTSGEVLVPWANIRDVAGTDILGPKALVIPKGTPIQSMKPWSAVMVPAPFGLSRAPGTGAGSGVSPETLEAFDTRVRALASSIVIVRGKQTTTLAKLSEADRRNRISAWHALGEDPTIARP